MKEIYVQLKDKYKDAFFETLKQEFQENGIRMEEIPEQLKEKQQGLEKDMTHTLILTDQKEIARWAEKKNVACVAYEAADSDYHFSGVDMVIQGFEQINAEFFCLIYRRHHGLPWKIAETDRLLIRESVMEDFDAIYDIYQEPGMTDYMVGISGTKEEEKEFLKSYIRTMYAFFGYGLWTVIEKKSGAIIGRVGLENATYEEEPVMELGYMISRAFQKKGYAIEAAEAVINYGMDAVGAEEIYVFIDEKNQSSLHLIGKTGAKEICSDRANIRTFLLVAENR